MPFSAILAIADAGMSSLQSLGTIEAVTVSSGSNRSSTLPQELSRKPVEGGKKEGLAFRFGMAKMRSSSIKSLEKGPPGHRLGTVPAIA